jgi:hypothetical protein
VLLQARNTRWFGQENNFATKVSPKATLWWEAVEGQSQVVPFTVMTVAAKNDVTFLVQATVSTSWTPSIFSL